MGLEDTHHAHLSKAQSPSEFLTRLEGFNRALGFHKIADEVNKFKSALTHGEKSNDMGKPLGTQTASP